MLDHVLSSWQNFDGPQNIFLYMNIQHIKCAPLLTDPTQILQNYKVEYSKKMYSVPSALSNALYNDLL